MFLAAHGGPEIRVLSWVAVPALASSKLVKTSYIQGSSL